MITSDLGEIHTIEDFFTKRNGEKHLIVEVLLPLAQSGSASGLSVCSP